MRIVNIKGGLGNQMFQYAFAVALKHAYPNEKIGLDTQLYHNSFIKEFRGNNFYHNGFELKRIFLNLDIPIASWREIAKVSYYIPNYILSQAARKILPKRKTEYLQSGKDAYIYDKDVLRAFKLKYFDGYWNSPLFFDAYKDEIIKSFTFQPFDTKENLGFEDKILRDNSVTLHVRRGDYLNIPIYQGICTLDYYKEAINTVLKFINSPVFFIFSNDPDWCVTNLKELFHGLELHIVSNNIGDYSFRDMQLMSLARCNIIANSSFSWWGAYLNSRKDHITIAPNKWVNLPCDKIYPQEWLTT